MASNNAFFRKMDNIQKRLPQVAKRLPGIAKVEGLKFIADNFQKEGFEEKKGSYKKWPERKRPKTKKKLIGEKRGASLKRSWQRSSKAAGTKTEFTSALPYAAVHNEGLKAGRPPHFTMPQSQMIGDSEALFERIEKKADSLIDKIME
jgi:phage gpG-like protein